MKKFLAFLLVVSLMMAFSATAMAASARSPQKSPTPAVVGGDNATDIKITPVTEAEDGSEESKVLNEVFDELKSAESLTALIPDLEQVVKSVDTDLKPRDVLVVVQYIDGKWVVIDPDDVVINADGTVSVTITSAAPIALLTKGA